MRNADKQDVKRIGAALLYVTGTLAERERALGNQQPRDQGNIFLPSSVHLSKRCTLSSSPTHAPRQQAPAYRD